MKCSDWQDLILTDYLDRQMNEEQAVLVEEHLSDCRECREFAANACKAVIEPFKQAQKAEPSEQVWQNIKEAIGEKQKSEAFVSLWDRLKEIIFMPRPAVVLATTVIVLMTATFTFNRYNQQFRMAKHAVIQSQAEDVSYLLDALAVYSEENNFYELTDIEEYFL